MAVEAERILRATAALHDVTVSIENMGEAGSAPCDEEARAIVRCAAEKSGATRIVEFSPLGGSEDATLMMDAVQARGGKATYLLVGTPLPAGHHHPRFDIDEAALPKAVALHAAIAVEILGG